MTIEEAFVELEDYVDASDPDMDSVRPLELALLRYCVLVFVVFSLPSSHNDDAHRHAYTNAQMHSLSSRFGIVSLTFFFFSFSPIGDYHENIYTPKAQSAPSTTDRRGNTQGESS